MFRPWRTVRTWWALVYLVLGFPFGLFYCIIVTVLVSVMIGMLPIFPVAVVLAALLLVVAPGFGRLERSRFAALLGVDLTAPHDSPPAGSWWSKLVWRMKSGSLWREIAYLLLAGPLGAVGFALAIGAWCGSLTLVALPAYVDALPGHRASFGLFDIAQDGGAVIACLVGAIGLLLIAPWVTTALAGLNVAAGRRLLERRPGDDLQQKVTKLEASRVAAVDTAERERQRIERDLHDGAQQRLVSVAMELGRAQEQFDSNPEGARELITGAHRDAKAALAELRQLVRGFHPAILEDRGLDAALSAVVARVSVPVDLSVDVPVRPPAAVESAAYFVVTEALANMAKHSQATRVSVTIRRQADRLVVEITDNGIGGADPTKGTGLAGLEERVAGHGGWMQVLSPPGGPTTVLVELPCAS
jgi:signal transduction histidine kinase